MVKKSELYFNPKVLPLRLIDLQATIKSEGGVYFCVPTDWDFHVISHTWTPAIVSLAQQSKDILSESGWTKDEDDLGLKYNETFTKKQFAGKAYYEELMEFLRILDADGVRKVWFDALCINQLNDDEKNREMMQMGAYYHLSNGCYVAPHGIGTESGFKALESNEKIPRWFSRVWTLQESILPNKLNFIVEKFDSTIIQFLVREETSHEDKLWIHWDDNLEITGLGDHSRRRIKNQESKSELYFLGAKAYSDMMHTLLTVRIHGFEDLPGKVFQEFYAAFGELAEGSPNIYVETLVKQIRVRNSSVEEDRVLGILGLIGFKGDHQVKSNQTLDLQLVDLAKMLLKYDPNMLIRLCAAEYEGYGSPGISWAPNLRADKDNSREEFRRYFINYAILKSYAATVVEVQEDGSIVMRTKRVRGTFIKSVATDDISYRLKVGALCIDLRHDVDLEGLLAIHPHGTDRHGYGNDPHGWQGGMLIPAPGIDKIKDYEQAAPLTVCEVTLLLLGYDGEPGRRGTTCVLMASVKIDENKLQKIGTFHPHPSLAPRVKKLFSSDVEECVVGGAGYDLTRFLSKDCQAILKSY